MAQTIPHQLTLDDDGLNGAVSLRMGGSSNRSSSTSNATVMHSAVPMRESSQR